MKSLTQNAFYNTIYKCTNLVFSLVSTAYASRILLAEGVGRVSSAQNIVNYFAILAALGIPTYGIKIIAANRENSEKLNHRFSELFCINGVSTIICVTAYYGMIASIPYFQSRWKLSAVVGMVIIANGINVDWFYQGLEDYAYIMRRSLAVKIGSLIALFLFVKSSDDVIIYALILTLATCANHIFNIIHARRYVRFTAKRIHISQHLKPVFVLLATVIAIEIYTLVDTTMLTFICEDKVVGYYTISQKCISIVRTMVASISAIFLPRLSYYYASKNFDKFHKLINYGIKVIIFIALPAFFGVVITANEIVPLFAGESFRESVLTTRILAISIISVAVSNFFGYQVLVTIGREKEMLYSTIIGAVINVILNIVLVFRYGHNGVAVASVVTEFCVTAYQTLVVKKYVKFTISSGYFASIIISSIFMGAMVMMCQHIVNGSVLRLASSIATGIVSYIVMSFILKNEIAVNLRRMIKDKFIKVK